LADLKQHLRGLAPNVVNAPEWAMRWTAPHRPLSSSPVRVLAHSPNSYEEEKHLDPPLDSEREVWFYDENALLRVWSEGVLFTSDTRVDPGPATVSARFTLYQVRGQLFVDVEVRGEKAVVRRGVLNGRSVESLAASSEVESLRALS